MFLNLYFYNVVSTPTPNQVPFRRLEREHYTFIMTHTHKHTNTRANKAKKKQTAQETTTARNRDSAGEASRRRHALCTLKLERLSKLTCESKAEPPSFGTSHDE